MPIKDLRCCYCDTPLGIDRPPYFSFRCEGFAPSRIRAQVFQDSAASPCWESEWLPASACGVSCDAKLQERTAYTYRILAEDSDGISHQSARARFETAFFERTFPNAKWIKTPGNESPIFFRTFSASNVQKARLYISTLGISHIYLNGRPVSNELLTPVYADYHRRSFQKLNYPIRDIFSYSHYYNTYDVTPFLTDGENVLAVWVGDGWYHQHFNDVEGSMDYGIPGVKFSLYWEDGEEERQLVSDSSVRWCESPVLSNGIFSGETYDGRIPLSPLLLGKGESRPVVLFDEFDSVPRSQLCPSDKVTQILQPRLVCANDKGTVYDAGVNISGVVSITTSAPAGEKITLWFGEVLTRDKTDVDMTTSGGCWNHFQSYTYISNGEPNQVYQPYFCIYGFRYFLVCGNVDKVCCRVVHADVRQEGRLITSSQILNQTIDIYQRSQLTNLHSGLPSDCPHRERLGYTGDGQLTVDTACYFYDMPAFYQKWMQDIIDGQCKISGHVQHTAPFAGGGGGPSGWGGAVIFAPWKLYRQYGNPAMLSDYYPQMLRWMGYIKSRSTDGILDREEPEGWCLGEWCTPTKTKPNWCSDSCVAITPAYVNSCLLVLQWQLLCKIAAAIGKNGDIPRFESEIELVRDAIRRHFYHEDTGIWDMGIQGADVFAWCAGLMDEREAQKRLSSYENQPLDTGIFGTPLLIESLCELGMSNIALHILSRTEYPSFGYMLENGATTLWERFELCESSHNHPMFGAVVGVMIRRFAGIQQKEGSAGYEDVLISPALSCGLEWIDCTIPTPRGPLSVKWNHRKDGTLIQVQLPWGSHGTLKAGGQELEITGGVPFGYLASL